MRQAISDAADSLPPPGPLLLAGMVDRADPHPTRAVTDRAAPLFDQDAVEVVPDRVAAQGEERRRAAAPTHARRAAAGAVDRRGRVDPRLSASPPPRSRRWAASKAISIPGLRGLTVANATAAAKAAGLDVVVTKHEAAPDPNGHGDRTEPGRGRVQRQPACVSSSCRAVRPTSPCRASSTCRGRRPSRRSMPRG